MPNFDSEKFSQDLYDHALDKELDKIQRALHLIQQYFTIQIREMDKQMKSDIARVDEHIRVLRDFIDAP
jgi:cob(I)alamin adenosyltransferase